jgi:hypothetical protein
VSNPLPFKSLARCSDLKGNAVIYFPKRLSYVRKVNSILLHLAPNDIINIRHQRWEFPPHQRHSRENALEFQTSSALGGSMNRLNDINAAVSEGTYNIVTMLAELLSTGF